MTTIMETLRTCNVVNYLGVRLKKVYRLAAVGLVWADGTVSVEKTMANSLGAGTR